MKGKIVILWLGILLVILNSLVLQKEKTVREGRTVLLELAPRDPRSLMQGDYMVLRYQLAQDLTGPFPDQGKILLTLDPQGLVTRARLDDGSAPNENGQWLRFRNRNGLRIGAESFLFEEGTAASFSDAKYGELKVDPQGSSVLIGLRDAKLQLLGLPVIR